MMQFAGTRRWFSHALAAAAFAVMSLLGAPASEAQEIFKQVQLTEAQIKGFIAAQPEMLAISEKMSGTASDKPDPKIQAELDAVAKKHGFIDFTGYDDAAANIAMVMAGIDPQSGTFTDPLTALKKEIEEVTKDKTLSEANRKQMLDELNEALKTTPPIQFPENIALVLKHRVEIDKVLQ